MENVEAVTRAILKLSRNDREEYAATMDRWLKEHSPTIAVIHPDHFQSTLDIITREAIDGDLSPDTVAWSLRMYLYGVMDMAQTIKEGK